MPNIVSPDVYVIEKDISEYAPTINSSVMAIVGFAGKGPTNKATLVTSPQQLVEKFGKPSENIYGQGLEGALEVLEATDSMYFVLCAATSAADASTAVAMGTCPAVGVSAGGYGVGTALYLKINVWDNAGNKQFVSTKTISLPAATHATDQSQAIIGKVGGGSDGAHIAAYDYSGVAAGQTLLIGAYAGSGAYMDITAYTAATMAADEGVSALYLIEPTTGAVSAGGEGWLTSGIRAWGTSIENRTDGQPYSAQGYHYHVKTIHPGAGYNAGTAPDGTTSGNAIVVSGLGGEHTQLHLFEDGVQKETFKVALTSSVGTHIETVVNTGETDLKSEIIKGNMASGTDSADFALVPLTNHFDSVTGLSVGAGALLDGSYRITNQGWNSFTTAYDGQTLSTNDHIGNKVIKAIAPKLIEGTYNLAGGDNGIPDNDISKASTVVGDAAVEPKTGMQSLDDDALNISVAATPGIHLESVQNNLITLAENTQNFIAVMSPPYGNGTGTAQDAIDWSNGFSTTRNAAISTSYAAIYWPWVKVFSVYDGKDRWLDPAIYGMRQMAYTDNVGETWDAPAGFVRGRLTKPSDVESKLTKGERDSLYSGGNVINPIVNFPQQGITVFGQRTARRTAGATDRINIRRLMIFLKKTILASARRFIFEPNDQFTWASIQNVLSPLLDDIARRRGISEFRVVCDETVNTTVRVDRNELWVKVLLKPTKTAEMIVFEINLTSQSAKLGNI